MEKGRRTGMSNISSSLLDLAECCQRFFDPNESEGMLKAILPGLDGGNLNVSFAFEEELEELGKEWKC